MINDADIERILDELDSRGFVTTRRGEIEAAAVQRLIGVDVRTLRGWRDRGIGPPHSRTVGSLALYRLEDVLAWSVTQRHGDLGVARYDRSHEYDHDHA